MQLVDPCESTSLTATTIPSQTLFKWNNLALSIPFVQFETALQGVDCGVVNYAVTSDQDVLSQSVGASTIEIVIDESAIPDGFVATFTLTGTLADNPGVSHEETFDITVYAVDCQST